MHFNPPNGAFRRRIMLNAQDDWCAAAVEDDFHRFVVRLTHDGDKIMSIKSRAIRTPWSICPEAGTLLQQLVGSSLTLRPWQDLVHIDAKTHCTHQYDLSLLAISQALRGGRREYDVTIPDSREPRRIARLELDEQSILDLTLDNTRILAPERLAGQDLRSIRSWALAHLDDDLLEAVYILRRVIMVSQGRGVDLDRLETTETSLTRMAGACYVYQPRNAPRAARIKGNIQDFSDRKDDLLKNLDPAFGP